jgi:thiol-disulfide isomerase/thioredoxin
MAIDMKAKLLMSLICAILCITHAKGQQYSALKVGDKVPDITITNFFNDPQRSEKISSLYNDKLLILDFWGTWCVPCIEAMPKFKILKAKYGDKIQILAVGYEPKEKLTGFFKRNPALNSSSYLVTYGDSVLTRKLFPHQSIPHVAWINKDGVVVAITTSDKVTTENIDKLLTGQKLNVRMKIDNPKISVAAIYEPFHLRDSNFQYRSILTKGSIGTMGWNGFQGGSDIEKVYHFNRSYFFNSSIYQLYWGALFNGRRAGKNNAGLKIITNDSLKYFYPKEAPDNFKRSKFKDFDNWADSNVYTYDLVLPNKVDEFTLRRYMIEDLNRALNLNGRYEMIESDCFILSKMAEIRTVLPLDSNELRKLYIPISAKKTVSLKALTQLLNEMIDHGIVIDDFSPDDYTKVTLNTAISRGRSLQELNRILSSLGFQLWPARRKVRVFVISEN